MNAEWISHKGVARNVRHLAVVLLVFAAGCTASFAVKDNSVLDAVPQAPLVKIDARTTEFRNEDVAVVSTRLPDSSFYGKLVISNINTSKDLEILWDTAVFVDEAHVASQIDLKRMSIPPLKKAEVHLSESNIKRKNATIPFMPSFDNTVIYRQYKVFDDTDKECLARSLGSYGLYLLLAWPFKYHNAKEKAKDLVVHTHALSQNTIDAYNGKTIGLRIPYRLGGVSKIIELRYLMIGKKGGYTVVRD